MWRGIFLGNRDLWFELNRHFFPNDRQSFSRQTSSVSRLDSSSADIYPLYSRPSVTLRQVFCTCSSAQVLLTISVECQTTQAYTCRQRINDIKVLSRSWVEIPTYFNLHSKDIREYAFLHCSEEFNSQSKSSLIHTPRSLVAETFSKILLSRFSLVKSEPYFWVNIM